MHLRMKTAEAILKLPSPFIRRRAGFAEFSLVLSLREGAACRFSASTWSDQMLTALAKDLLAEVGWKTVEHAARRQVVVKCRVPETRDAAIAEIDCGDGFVNLPLLTEGEGER